MKNPAKRQFKDAIYGQLARIGKSLASGPRLEILDVLDQGPRTVESLAGEIGRSVANTSQHLQILRRARMVDSEREGVSIVYRIADDGVAGLVRSLRKLAESRLLEIEQISRSFFEQHTAMEPIDREHLVRRVRSGEVTVLDVRPQVEYSTAHIAGAISVPLEHLETRLAELPKNKEIVAYCRGPYCVMAVEAVERLLQAGFKAAHLDEGVSDWRARGLPVESAPAGESL